MARSPEDVVARTVAIVEAFREHNAGARDLTKREHSRTEISAEYIAAAIVADALAGVAEQVDELGVETSRAADEIDRCANMLDRIDDRLERVGDRMGS